MNAHETQPSHNVPLFDARSLRSITSNPENISIAAGKQRCPIANDGGTFLSLYTSISAGVAWVAARDVSLRGEMQRRIGR